MKIQGNDEAICCFDKVLEIDPKNADALGLKGCSLRELGKYDEAIQRFDKVLEIDPKSVPAWHNKGNTNFENTRYQ